MSGRRGLAALAVVVALVASLGGCAVIPESGGVHVAATEAPNQQDIVFLPNPPTDGATPEQIVQGFVQAASEGKNYAVAREFLTPDFARAWRPDARVLLHDQSWSITSGRTPGSVSLTVPVSARVNEAGAYVTSADTVPVGFHLTKVSGQWRIAKTADGIVLAQTVFQQIWVHRALQFWDPTFHYLVPDVRWFPPRGSQAGAVVDAVLAGPAPQLGSGVTASVFPAGSRRLSVGTTGTTTTVVLRVPGPAPSALTLGRMRLQIAESLHTARLADLDLVVNGRPVTAPVPQPLSTQPNTLPIAFAGSRFGVVSAAGITQDALGKRVATLKPAAATVASRQGFAAVLNSRGVSVVTRSGVRLVDPRPDLTAPTVDQRGWTYSVPADDPSGLEAFTARDRRAPLAVRLPGSRVVAIEASPDGTRMLVLLQTSDGDFRALVAGITRAADGAPTGLTSDQYPIPVGSDKALDATWVDNGSVALLTGKQDDEEVAVTLLGGGTSPLGRLSNATEVVGATTTNDLRVRLSTGAILVWNTVWQPEFRSPVDVSALAVQR